MCKKSKIDLQIREVFAENKMEVVVAAESKMREGLALLQTFSFIIEYEAIADSGEIYARHVPVAPPAGGRNAPSRKHVTT